MTAIQTSRQTDFVFNGSFLHKEGARYISFQTVLSSQYMTRQTIKQTNCKAPCIIDAWLIGFFFQMCAREDVDYQGLQLQEVRSELADAKTELSEVKCELGEAKTELSEVKYELNKVKSPLESKLAEVDTRLEEKLDACWRS